MQNLDGDEFHRKLQNLFRIERIQKQIVYQSEEEKILCCQIFENLVLLKSQRKVLQFMLISNDCCNYVRILKIG